MARLTGEQLKDSYQNLLTIDATIESDPLTGQLENGLGNAITALGIGTDSPDKTLHILNSDVNKTAQLKISDGSSDTSAYIGSFANTMWLTNGGTYSGSWQLDGSYGVGVIEIGSVDGGSLIRLNTASSNTTSTERMKVHSSGDISFRDTSANEAFYWDASTARLGIGNQAPTVTLDVTGDIALSNDLYISNGNFIKLQRNSGGLYLDVLGTPSGTDDVRLLTSGAFDLVNGSLTSMLKVDSSGNVGIGASPNAFSNQTSLTVRGASVSRIDLQGAGGSGGGVFLATATETQLGGNFNIPLKLFTSSTAGITFETNSNPRMTIDSSGNVLVGKTASNYASEGIELRPTEVLVTKDSGTVLSLRRNTSDGTIISFAKDGSSVGSIGVTSGSFAIGQTDTGIGFFNGDRIAFPATSAGAVQDNAIDLGYASGRWKDLYLGGNAYANGFYQNGSVTDNLVISQGTGTSRPSVGLWGNDHASFPGQVHIVSNSSNADADSGEIRFYDFTGSAFQINMTIDKSGNVDVAGALSKGSGSFKIDHPLESKKDTHYLVHSFVESPQANNIYRGSVDLSDGQATVNLDEVSGMTDGTFVLLNTDIHVYTSNESDWDAVKGSVSDNVLTIECQNSLSNAKVNWLVIGERHDQHMIDTNWTDENGKVIVEPLKPIENELEN